MNCQNCQEQIEFDDTVFIDNKALCEECYEDECAQALERSIY